MTTALPWLKATLIEPHDPLDRMRALGMICVVFALANVAHMGTQSRDSRIQEPGGMNMATSQIDRAIVDAQNKLAVARMQNDTRKGRRSASCIDGGPHPPDAPR